MSKKEYATCELVSSEAGLTMCIGEYQVLYSQALPELPPVVWMKMAVPEAPKETCQHDWKAFNEDPQHTLFCLKCGVSKE